MRNGLALSSFALGFWSLPSADASTWQRGDVFVGIGNGRYAVYGHTGDSYYYKETIDDGLGGSETGGCAFNVRNSSLYTTNITGRVSRFDVAHPHAHSSFPTDPDDTPESIVFATSGSFYVGHPDGARDIWKYSQYDSLQQTYDVAVEAWGSDWLDLALDQHTMFYTSEGRLIKRYDVADTGAQLSDFADLSSTDPENGPVGRAFALRLLGASCDGNDGVIVADYYDVKRIKLDASGKVVVQRAYDVAGEDHWFAANLDSNRTSFWSAGYDSHKVYRFNIATGAVEVQFDVDDDETVTSSVAGICVMGEATCAPPVADADGPYAAECHGGGGTLQLDGRLSFDPADDPLTFNWTTDNCPGALFDDPSSATPSLSVYAQGSCTVDCIVTLTVTDPSGLTDTDSSTVTIGDSLPPEPIDPPAAVITVQCDAVPPPEALDFDDDCQGILTDEPEQSLPYNQTCTGIYDVQRIWEGQDKCSNETVVEQTIHVRDTTAPVFTFVPGEEWIECDAALPPVGQPTATDNCGTVTIAYLGQVRTDGACLYDYTLTRTWTATDDCGNAGQASQTIHVQDTKAPEFTFVPGETTVECNAVPAVGQPTATDNCGQPQIAYLGETRTDGPCPDTYTLTRRWEATDQCAHTTPASQTIHVQDTTAPVLSGAPGTLWPQCNAVPAPQVLTATDNCDDDVPVGFSEVRTDLNCPYNYMLTRTWTATDDCLNNTQHVQVVNVRDTTPPVVVGPGSRLACEWPPNHKYVCYDGFTDNWDVSDNCTAVPALAVACVSSQCDDAPCAQHPGENGDGNTVNDCVYNATTDRLGARSERAGNRPEGRNYTETLTATDECGNSTSNDTTIYVPHDQKPHEDCLRPPNGPPCWQ
jgi:hypothetical protein